MRNVVISGAGPAGLTLAIELARRDMDFVLIDRAPHPFIGSQGKGIQPCATGWPSSATPRGTGTSCWASTRRTAG